MFSGDLFCQSQPVGAVCDRTWAGHPGGGGLKLAVTVGPQSASSWRTAPETPPGSESALTRPLCRKRVWWVPHRKADKNKEKDLSDGESLRPFCGSFWLKYCVGMRGITTEYLKRNPLTIVEYSTRQLGLQVLSLKLGCFWNILCS